MAISTHSIRSSAATAWETDGAVVIFRAGHGGFGPKARAVDHAIGGAAGRAASAPRFSGKSGDCIDILAPVGLKARRVVVLDLGDPAALTALSASRAGSSLARHLENEGEQTALVLFETSAGAALAGNDLLAQILLGMRLRNYRFALMARTEKAFDLTLTLEHDEAEAKPLVRSEAVADGVALARTLVNYPASHLNPDNFADYLEPLQAAGIAVEVLDKAELERLGMGAILAVGNGSARGPRVIVLRYKGAEGQPLALVGKGMCFDAGGLCIKTGPQMFTMKGDMGGAAAVIGAMLALARQKAAVHVVGVLGVAENMLSGSSYKPGDIVTTMSGRTVEVFDTDCEGRMVLADVLHYTATRFQPKAIVDLATLTYSVMRGLGHAFAGLFATHDELANGLLAAGEATGERFWRLPLDPAYEENLISPIADLRQHGRDLEDGDAPVAAAFLKTFAEGVPYVHLDIAGKELIDQDRLHARAGGAGFGVQLLEEWITSGAAAKFRG
ncbi:leucyl aminopeptidase [Fuscovulum blasticum]|uniref:leucyl aminopeptidase n=1 Tax=Fuscovulum blasticum TaxID=1075 RepID=UPI000D3E7080|nr:leucyl aminopeptidase [Fuscovulum blasticum]AWD23488.1 leucyl aminopeptidase [Fuscovulum blasticum]